LSSHAPPPPPKKKKKIISSGAARAKKYSNVEKAVTKNSVSTQVIPIGHIFLTIMII
jgi:hypothetical protein